MSFFRHLGKKKAKFAFTLLIRTAEQLETTSWKNGQAAHLQAKRGSKSVQTKVALLEDHILRWNEALSFVCTMYKKEVKGQKEPEWQPKIFVLSLKADVKEESKWRVEVDMSKFIKDGGQMEVIQTLSLSQKDGPVLKLTVRSHDIDKSQPYDPFDFSNEPKDSNNSSVSGGAATRTLGRGMSKKELKTPATPGAVSEADRKRLLHRRGESMVMGVAAVESPPSSPKGDGINLGTNDEPPFVLTRSGSRKKMDEDDSELTEEQKAEKRWDERIRKATTPRAASGGAAAANGFQHDTISTIASTTLDRNGTSSNGRIRTPTNGNRKGSHRSKSGSDSDNDSHDDDKNNDTTTSTTTNGAPIVSSSSSDTSVNNNGNGVGHSRKESRRSSKVMFDEAPLGPTPNGGTHERRSSLKPPSVNGNANNGTNSDQRPERRGSRQGTPFPSVTIDTPNSRATTSLADAASDNSDTDSDDGGGLRGKRRIDDDERNRIGGGGGTSTRARDAPSTPAFRPGGHDDDDFFDRQGGGVTAKFEQATDDGDGDGDMTPERTLSDGGIERDSGVADLARLHDHSRGSVIDHDLPPIIIGHHGHGHGHSGSGGAGAPKKPHRRGFSRFQHASAAGGERPGSRAKATSADGSNKKLSIDATSRLALHEEDETTPRALGELNPQQLARLTAMHATPISPRASPSTPRGAR